jgi:hypothetical protein
MPAPFYSDLKTWSSPAQESGINEGRVRERRLCRSVVLKRSTGVVECWSIVQDSVFDGVTRVPQNCHG